MIRITHTLRDLSAKKKFSLTSQTTEYIRFFYLFLQNGSFWKENWEK